MLLATPKCTSRSASGGPYTSASFARSFCAASVRSGKTSAKCSNNAGASSRATTLAGHLADTEASEQSDSSFASHQKKRRKELWGLLGDLPWQHRPGPPKLLSTEEHEDYTVERLVLDLNGIEPVPALLLIPRRRQTRAPGLLYIHWHGGMYDLGKEQLLRGVKAQPPTRPCAPKKG